MKNRCVGLMAHLAISMSKIPRDFYEQPTLQVARFLLGAYLVHRSEEGVTVGKIVETEAYGGEVDLACHAAQGRRTVRTEVMFGPAGYAYVYLIYGMYECFNIVTGPVDDAQAVLIRAIEPVEGIDIMKARRNTQKLTNLCSGPGKLCRAMGITRELYGADLCGEKIYLVYGEDVPEEDVVRTPRINVDYAGAAKDFLWRFLVKGNTFVSKSR